MAKVVVSNPLPTTESVVVTTEHQVGDSWTSTGAAPITLAPGASAMVDVGDATRLVVLEAPAA